MGGRWLLLNEWCWSTRSSCFWRPPAVILLQWKAHELPIYPVPVRAGFAALLASEGDRGQLEIVRIYKPSPELRKAGTLVFEIDEVPMEPQLRAGMLVAGTTVPL